MTPRRSARGCCARGRVELDEYIGAGRALGAALYGVGGSDLRTLAAVTAGLALAGTLAALLPAQRALAIDPIVALRRD